MKLKIGTQVLVEPKTGLMDGQEFTARIVDIVDGKYVVTDQDEECFTVGEDEVSELNPEDCTIVKN
mgnify:CR=1 FL=1